MLTTLISVALALALSFGAITTAHHGTHAGPPAATTFCNPNSGGTITGGGPLPGC